MNVALRPEHLNMLSICTGGGGLDLGVELAIPGARAVCMVEREAFAVARLVSAMEQGLLAQAPVWTDARTFDGRRWRGCVDGLIGGIPCQPHSLAGKRQGKEDERDLWSTARRIIVQSGAWFVLIENVRGMLSSGGAERVWRDLRRLGFEVECGLFAAAEVGATHERERVFILAVADARCPERWSLVEHRCLADGYETGRYQGAGRFTKPGTGIPSVGLADTFGERLERDTRREIWDQQQAVKRSGQALVDAESERRGEGRPEPEFRSRRDSSASALGTVADSDVIELRRQSSARQQQIVQRDNEVGLFPPGPGDRNGWRVVLERAPHLEPAVRRVADGMASRVDELRMLGNGVVPLQAAYAVRTLATRLAERGSAGADQLVRMMEVS